MPRPPDASEMLRATLRKLLEPRGAAAQLARDIKVRPSTITEWVKGENNPGLDKIGPIAASFKLTVPELFGSDLFRHGGTTPSAPPEQENPHAPSPIASGLLEDRDVMLAALEDIAAIATRTLADRGNRSGSSGTTGAKTRPRGRHRRVS